jgi:hypothetical protein
MKRGRVAHAAQAMADAPDVEVHLIKGVILTPGSARWESLRFPLP